MPGIDALAVTDGKETRYIQVKAQTGSGWSVNINERLYEPTRNMFWVLVLLPKTGESPSYWVIPDEQMRDIIRGQYEDRPHQFEKTTWCLKDQAVSGWEDGWALLG